MKTEEIMDLADSYADGVHTEGYFGARRRALQSAIEALQADAARYRVVREAADFAVFCPPENDPVGCDMNDWRELVGAELDVAIDAAMAQDKP